MRRALVLAALVAPLAALAFDFPSAPSRFLYDGANALSGSDRQQIEERLMALNQQGLQVGVAIFPSLQGEDLEDTSNKLFQAWGIGSKQQSDGALVAVFMNDRKMRIEVGYGLEDKVPDAVARQIISTQMKPAFRAGRFADGILGAVNGIAAATGRAAPVQRAYPVGQYRYATRGSPQGLGGLLCPCLALFVVIMFIRLLSRATRPRYYGFGNRTTYAPSMPWWAWLLLGNAMSGRRHDRGGWGGGGWGGGGGGFGGGGGGSFGGGMSGGGGASGSW